jgi:hypothetical protein
MGWGSPDWIEWFNDNWEAPLPWYKRWFYRLIIEPVDDFCSWWYHNVTDKWHDFNNAKMRVKKGYDWCDIWNMNDWFVTGAVGILEDWKAVYDADPEMEFPCGTPCIKDEDGNNMTHEKWTSILLEMLEGFKLWHDFEGSGNNWVELDEEPTYANMIVDRDGIKIERDDEKYPNMSYWHNGAHFMKFDGVWTKCGMNFEEEDKYQHALNLFAKYHAALWD